MSNYIQKKHYSDNEYRNCKDTYGKNLVTFNDHSKWSPDYFIHTEDTVLLKTTSRDFEQVNCSFVDRNFVFNVKNLSLVKSFSLSHLTFDGYIQVDLNDHLAYIGPSEGKHLTIISSASRSHYHNLNIDQETSQIYNGEEFMPCQNNQTWVIDTKIGLKSFLQEGNNTLSLRIFEDNRQNLVEIEIHSSEYCPHLLAGEETSSSFDESCNN